VAVAAWSPTHVAVELQRRANEFFKQLLVNSTDEQDVLTISQFEHWRRQAIFVVIALRNNHSNCGQYNGIHSEDLLETVFQTGKVIQFETDIGVSAVMTPVPTIVSMIPIVCDISGPCFAAIQYTLPSACVQLDSVVGAQRILETTLQSVGRHLLYDDEEHLLPPAKYVDKVLAHCTDRCRTASVPTEDLAVLDELMQEHVAKLLSSTVHMSAAFMLCKELLTGQETASQQWHVQGKMAHWESSENDDSFR